MKANLLEPVFALWDRVSAFPASQTEEALRHLMEWFRAQLDADNVLWLGSVLMLNKSEAKKDTLLGWRLRVRRSLLPETEHYRKLVASYFGPEHFGKLTPAYYKKESGPETDLHVGEPSRKLVEGAGAFRVHRLRDGWVDFAKLRQSEHFRLYYRELGITDRIWVAFPVSATVESIFRIDRHRRPTGPRRNFTRAESELAGTVLRGMREFHRRLLLQTGVLVGSKSLSPVKLRLLQGLLTKMSEKDIAASTGQKPLTMRKYVTELYKEFGVKSRTALMALWLGEA